MVEDPDGNSTNMKTFSYTAETSSQSQNLGTIQIGNHQDGRKCQSGEAIESWDVLATFTTLNSARTVIELLDYVDEYGSDVDACASSTASTGLGRTACTALNLYKTIRESKTISSTGEFQVQLPAGDESYNEIYIELYFEAVWNSTTFSFPDKKFNVLWKYTGEVEVDDSSDSSEVTVYDASYTPRFEEAPS